MKEKYDMLNSVSIFLSDQDEVRGRVGGAYNISHKSTQISWRTRGNQEKLGYL